MPKHSPSYWLAFSGGMDSHVLLHFLKNHFAHLSLRAIHINHQLLPQAEAWEQHCQKICDELQTPLHITRVTISQQASINRGLEAAARQARYAALAQYLQPEDILFTAHHLDDQAETVLLRLLRGAGLHGMSAMRSIAKFANGYLVRPLLHFSRAELLAYARCYKLNWIDDPSNQDQRFDRNFLRQTILPLLQQRWPQAHQTLSKFAQHCAEQEQIILSVAEQDCQQCCGKSPHNLSIAALKNLAPQRQQNLLRYWIRQQHSSAPPRKILEQLQFTLLNARQDANPEISWSGITFRRYRDQLLLINNPSNNNSSDTDILSPEQKQWCQQHLPYPLDDQHIRIQYRRGGERFRPAGSRYTRSLKNLFQEWGIPPWQRAHIPLIYYQDKLIAVVGYANSIYVIK